MIFEDIKIKWDQFLQVPFPNEAHEQGDLDLSLIDTFAAGCISSYIGNSGRLDRQNHYILGRCVTDLEKVIHLLDGSTRSYFDLLLIVSKMVLESTK